MDVTILLQKAREYLPAEKLPLLEAAYQFAAKAHEGQVRKSGEPFLEHPLETAVILADLQLDASTLAAALLHDVPEDCGVSISEIEIHFGFEVAKLVDATTKLSKVSWRIRDEVQTPSGQVSQAENLRKMLLAMAEDLRVVFIKLADRLHNMRTLAVLPEQKRQAISSETLEIFAPLAHRLGIWDVKWQLEDLAFRYLEPKEYHRVARLIVTRRAQREEFINEVTETLRKELEKAGVKAEVFGRPKHIYSISQKMQKYSAQGKNFGDIHDLSAVRVLVDTVSDCYKVLGVIHGLWHPLLEEFNDFIANPKDNGYQSLHTTVLCGGATPLEMQIRTYAMHRIAEYGIAAVRAVRPAGSPSSPPGYRRGGGSEFSGYLPDNISVYAGYRRDIFRLIRIECQLFISIESGCPVLNEVVIVEPFAYYYIGYGHGQGTIGAGVNG